MSLSVQALVLIEKDTADSGCWLNLSRRNKPTGLSVEEVIKKYQGFEGDLISFFSVEDNEEEIEINLNQMIDLKALGNCSLIYVISGFGVVPPQLRNKLIQMGYDVGVCDEEKTIYSSIYNEILFGVLDELVCYKELLNEHLLFPDMSLAQKYIGVHNEMSALGKDVEDYEEMSVYEIWRCEV